MPQLDLPCILMRGGTSKGPYFNAADLPSDRDSLARIDQAHTDVLNEGALTDAGDPAYAQAETWLHAGAQG